MGEIGPRVGSTIITVHSTDHKPPHVHVFHKSQKNKRKKVEVLFKLDKRATVYEIRERGTTISDSQVAKWQELVLDRIKECKAEWERCHGKSAIKPK